MNDAKAKNDAEKELREQQKNDITSKLNAYVDGVEREYEDQALIDDQLIFLPDDELSHICENWTTEIELIMAQTGRCKLDVVRAYHDNKRDLVDALISLGELERINIG